MASPLESAVDASKSRWDQVLTVTPVILTVLGTLLAGLSSSEMTLAQYYRTLAAQSQAKASDQWAFFQAKRIRGTSIELFVKQLPLLAQRADALSVDIREASAQLHAALRQANAAAGQLRQAIGKGHDHLNEQDAARLTMHGSDLFDESQQGLKRISTLAQQLNTILGDSAFPRNAHLEDPPKLHPFDPAVQRAFTNQVAGRAAATLEADLLPVPPALLQESIEDAAADVLALEAALAPGQQQLRALAQVIEAEVALVPVYYRRVRKLEETLAAQPLDGKDGTAVKEAMAIVSRDARAAAAAAEHLRNQINLVEQTYLAHSYRLEADRNQRLAQLYELQVRQNGGLAERHRNRSRSFFYGMLCAQAGVTISSLALAARQKNLLWALAGTAGLAALVFSLYVYLYV